MNDYHISLTPDKTYHIFSRAMGSEKLFIEKDNYIFFLRQYLKYIQPIAETFAYDLLPNHFHFMIRIKKIEVIRKLFKTIKKKKRKFKIKSAPEFIMERFSNLLNSYAKTFNKKYSRKGGLFIDIMKRIEVEEVSQFAPTISYIHKNAVHHGYCNEISKWPWSSYLPIIFGSSTQLLRDELLDFFGVLDALIEFHKHPAYLKNAIVIDE